MSRLVKCPSGMIVDADRLIFTPKDTGRIGQVLFCLQGFPPDFAIILESTDVDAMIAAGVIQELKAPPKIQS